jgi:hypothetical protein
MVQPPQLAPCNQRTLNVGDRDAWFINMTIGVPTRMVHDDAAGQAASLYSLSRRRRKHD